MKKRILITGATGLIGSRLTNALCTMGAYVKVLTTNPSSAKKLFKSNYTIEILDSAKFPDSESLSKQISETDAIVNLGGANLGARRWNSSYKELIYDSRIELTEHIAEGIRYADPKPEVLVNASGVGIYGDTGDEIVTEESGTGNDFLAKVCKDWESKAMEAIPLGVRVTLIRTGIVLDMNGGALPQLLLPFKFFAGAYHASGKQWISWIHIDDIVSLYLKAIEDKDLSGPVNGTSPAAVRNKDFIITAGKILGRGFIMPVPAFALKIAAGEFAESIIAGQRVVPRKAINSGFIFKYPELDEALRNLLRN